MELESILLRLVQIGTVSAVDNDKRKVRVIFQDTGATSGWLYVLQHYAAGLYIEPDAEHTHTITGSNSASTCPAHDHIPGSYLAYWMPKVNDIVLVLYLPLEDSDGFILGGM
ncbi:hypothetical protein [Anaeromassilibacillus senegalensis]|uniref:hypothetical protein n=1 Tax=Anaeromassilibacillus senegalensis TaxID=1673717 RepID=UPI000681EB4C|nr:hypothetical protein [Anaeromassilibacillus senegalensis]